MFALGQEAPTTEEEALNQKAQVFQNVTDFRDQLFEGNQGKMVKVVGGVLTALYLINRFLMK